jgi:polyhydroxyalkanoate synthesis regulator phasin
MVSAPTAIIRWQLLDYSELRNWRMVMSEEKKIGSWKELFEKTVELGLGAALLTKESATKFVDELVQRGHVTKDESKKLVTDLLEKGKGQKQRMEDFVSEVVEKALHKADVARASHIEELERRLAALEERLGPPQEP